MAEYTVPPLPPVPPTSAQLRYMDDLLESLRERGTLEYGRMYRRFEGVQTRSEASEWIDAAKRYLEAHR